MVEYNDKIKFNLLKIWNFDIDNLDIDKIEHVPMHQFRISSCDKPMLFVENLQCCVCLYAIVDGYSFAAHINPVVIRGDEFDTLFGKVTRCKRIDDMKEFIIKYAKSNESPIIGIVFGVRSLSMDDKNMQIIYDGLDNLLWELEGLGYSVDGIVKSDAPEFIIDSQKGEFILPKEAEKRCR